MSHSVNMGLRRLIDSGLPLSASVMFACPWYDAELGTLLDMNTDQPLADMGKNRQGELDALTSPRFAQALKGRSIRLLTYRDLIGVQGLQAMHRPAQ